MNGRWSEWGPHTKCTKTCGVGVRKWIRRCNNPAPKYGGKKCPGAQQRRAKEVQQRKCWIKACRK